MLYASRNALTSFCMLACAVSALHIFTVLIMCNPALRWFLNDMTSSQCSQLDEVQKFAANYQQYIRFASLYQPPLH